MKTHNTLRQFSKFLSYILGRCPFEFGLVPDEGGFVPIPVLLKAINEEKEWKHIRTADFHELLLREPEPPVQIAGNRIRSVDPNHLPKHTVSVDPSKLLYVCVRQKAHAHVLEKGISPSTSSRVILSSDKEMALRIGRRYDLKAVLLSVYCDKCREQGILFYHVGGTLFTAEHIPPRCFTRPALALERETKIQATDPVAQQPKRPGSFILEIQKENPILPKVKGRKKEIPWKKNRKRLLKKPEYPA
jgi:putative RNA 2'-phosphotransferase